MTGLPPQHKKRLYQGIFAYLLLVLCAGIFIVWHGDETLKFWNDRIPHARAPIVMPVEKPPEAFLLPAMPQVAEDALATPAEEADQKNDEPEAKPNIAAGEKTFVAVIVTNGGISSEITEQMIDTLPPAIAIAFSPYAPGIKEWVEKAGKKNHETLMLLPMEPSTYPKDDPGAKALLTRLGEKENEELLAWSMDRAPKIVGMMNFMGDRFLSDEPALIPVFAQLHSRNLIFIQDPAFAGRSSAAAANTANADYLAADAHIGAADTEMAIRQQLVELEKSLAQKGFAVAVVSPYPTTLHILTEWLGSLDNRGIRLVPLTEVNKIAKRGHSIEKQDAATAAGHANTP